jgi:HEAT repeat protein
MLLRCAVLLVALVAGLVIPLPAQDPATDDPKEREKSAKAMGDQGSTAIGELAKLAKDPEYKVRLQAIKSIVKIGTQHSLDPLIEGTKDADPEIQILAVNGLVNFYLPGYVQTGISGAFKKTATGVKGQFTDVNDAVVPYGLNVREDVIVAIGNIAGGGSSMPSRANAARGVGILRGKSATPDLLKAVKTKDSDVIYESLIAMQKIGEKSAAEGITFLLRDLDDDVQIAAIETTGLLQYREALPQLHTALNEARNKKVRRAALTAIAMLPDESSRVYYTQFIGNKDTLVRAAAAEGYGRLKNGADLQMMEANFESEKKMNPRLSMAFALVLMGRTDSGEFTPLQYLINALNSSSFNGVAEPFLVELAREASVREAIYAALPGGTKDEKISLAHVLSRSGDQTSVEHLQTLSRDPDPEVATEGSRALQILRIRLG